MSGCQLDCGPRIPRCTLGETRCDDDSLLTCEANENGTAYWKRRACPYHCDFLEDQCEKPPDARCAGRRAYCDGSWLVECGAWGSEEDCGADGSARTCIELNDGMAMCSEAPGVVLDDAAVDAAACTPDGPANDDDAGADDDAGTDGDGSRCLSPPP